MTVVVWDGVSLCADKRGLSAGWKFTVTKIFKTDLGLIGIDGNYDVGLQLINWLKEGGLPKDYPEVQKNDDRYAFMVLITPEKKILKYERQPFPLLIEESFYATGCGRDYALGALGCGKTAREAVEVACRFDNGCGNGIDELFL